MCVCVEEAGQVFAIGPDIDMLLVKGSLTFNFSVQKRFFLAS